MLAILSLIVTLVVAALIFSNCKRFGEGKEVILVKVIIYGLLSGVINFLAPKVPIFIAVPFFYVIVLALMGYLIYWWHQEGSNVPELLTHSGIMFILMLIGKSAAARVIDTNLPRGLIGVLNGAPLMLFVVGVGFFAADAIWFNLELESLPEGNVDTDTTSDDSEDEYWEVEEEGGEEDVTAEE